MELSAVRIDTPDDVNVIIGQSHFIKTVEDLHECLVGISPHLRFGLAFCEASGQRLVRRSGNDPDRHSQPRRSAWRRMTTRKTAGPCSARSGTSSSRTAPSAT